MRIVPFPQREDSPGDGAVAELERALHGADEGPAADSWRALREDVRALAPPMDPQFAHELRERIEERAARPPRRGRVGSRVGSASRRARAWLGSGLRPRVLAGLGICVAAAVVTLAIAPWRGSESQLSEQIFKAPVSVAKSGSLRARGDQLGTSGGPTKERKTSGAPSSSASKAESATNLPAVAATGSAGGPASSSAPSAESASARVQQRAATITLAPKPEGVQSVADEVAQLAARDGGFVQSSQVHLQRGDAGEANLQLSLPSARLSAALAELARLAPSRAQSQSLQDITDEHNAARTKLADAVAGRQALLRALSRASTQGEIESLRARLALAGAAITRARSALQSVSKRGSTSVVEVTVLGDAHAGGGGSTLSTALHDAGDVLKVALAVLIVALAVLVPLAILLAALLSGWRASRRRLRERALS